MKNGWTGGQLAILRFVLAIGAIGALAWPLLRTAMRPDFPGADPVASSAPTITFALAVVLLVCAAVGLGTRWIALGAACFATWLAFVQPLGISPDRTPLSSSLLVFGVLAIIANSPLGSWPIVPRVAPERQATFPPWLFALVWLVLVAIYAFGAAHSLRLEPTPDPDDVFHDFGGLSDPLTRERLAVVGCEALFVLTSPFARLRRWSWLAMLIVQLVVRDPTTAPYEHLAYIELGLGTLALHVLAFDPAWIAPRGAFGVERIFYDGSCGLCHRFVTFVIAEDRDASFRFAPLGGATFEREVEASARAELPDSVVVRTANGELLVRSKAALYVLERLGGLWRALALVARLVPRPLADFLYDRIARLRKKLFAKPTSACPRMPPELALRFDS